MTIKKKKKVRFRKIEIKVSNKQKSLLDRFCKVHKTSTKRLIKRSVKEFLERHASNPEHDDYISPNQLKLFEEEGSVYEELAAKLPAVEEIAREDPEGLFSMLNHPGKASGLK